MAFRARIEEDLRYLIDSLPPANRLYQNEDGTPRQPSDLELHKLAHLSALNEQRTLKFWEWFTIGEKEGKLYKSNTDDIARLLPSDSNGAQGDIVDKVPFEDKNGNIQWKFVRENEEEGWEKLSYYLLLPALAGLVGIHLFKEDTGVDQWALEELKRRAGQGAELKDEEIVEKILSGEYDKLLELKKKLWIGVLKESRSAYLYHYIYIYWVYIYITPIYYLLNPLRGWNTHVFKSWLGKV